MRKFLIIMCLILLSSCSVPGEKTLSEQKAECLAQTDKVKSEISNDFNIDVIGGEIAIEDLFFSSEKEACYIVYSYEGDNQKSTFLIEYNNLFSVKGIESKEGLTCKSRFIPETEKWEERNNTCDAFNKRVNSLK